MSKGGRWGLVALAVAVVVAAFVIARPGDDDDGGGQAASTTTVETETSPTATAPSAPEPPADGPDPVTARFDLVGHVPRGGVEDIEVEKGERVRIVVRSDLADDIHVHGYDIEQPVGPGAPMTFTFRADIEGIFEIESHQAEHVGKDALIGRLVVEPS